jgi:hypothetical protein
MDTSSQETIRGHQRTYQKDEEEIIERVIEFLDQVFNEQIEFWTAGNAGGWHARGKEPLGQWPNRRTFVWSGPITRPEE